MKHSTNIGKIFGCMRVMESRTVSINGKPNSQYRIQCVICGSERWHNENTVRRGTAKCYHCDPLARPYLANRTAQKAPKGLYNRWRGMVRRCTQETCDQWPHYGGRGIRVCKEWLYDFNAFVDWALTNGWDETKTIDRFDNDGDYEPGNCRWVDQKAQTNNQSKNIRVDFRGERLTLAQFCERTGIQYDRARYLIFRKGLTPEEALSAK